VIVGFLAMRPVHRTSDSRFVGTWTSAPSSNRLVFSDDGTGTSNGQQFEWQVADGQLWNRSKTRSLQHRLERIVRGALGFPTYDFDAMKIVDTSSDMISLQGLNGSITTLTRVPDSDLEPAAQPNTTTDNR
jgi:hypothetical protein